MPAKLTKEGFDELKITIEQKASIKILDDFSKYVNQRAKLNCECTTCGMAQQKSLEKLKLGRGCTSKSCMSVKSRKKPISQAEFNRRCSSHKAKFNMSVLTTYANLKGALDKILMVCDICGEQQEKRMADLERYGCSNRGCGSWSKSFISVMSGSDYSRAKANALNDLHLDILTDYSKLRKLTDRVDVRCTICNKKYDKTLKGIIGGQGCNSCASRGLSKKTITTDIPSITSDIDKYVDSKEYLNESKLGDFLRDIFKVEFIYNRKVQGSGIMTRPDYRSDSLMLIVEFDGEGHYCNIRTITNDKLKDEVYTSLGYKVVRIPYFIQLNTDIIKTLFDIDVEYRQEYPHGFVNKKAKLPSEFSEAGLERFVKDLKRFDMCTADIVESLRGKINDLRNIDLVLPRSLQGIIKH